jgi:hypothetical protein
MVDGIQVFVSSSKTAVSRKALTLWVEVKEPTNPNIRRESVLADVQAALERVIAGRVALGALPLADLPKGDHHGNSCPIANALKEVAPEVSVSASQITGIPRARAPQFAAAIGGELVRSNGTAVVTPPEELAQFVTDYDAGFHSQYDQNSW